MQCLRCGRKTEEGNVFCVSCLADMKEYPVKPGTVVQLPPKLREPQPVKPPVRRQLSPEEQLKRLKNRGQVQGVLMAALLLLVIGLSVLAVYLAGDTVSGYLPGQNYTSEQSAQTTEAE